MNPFEEAARFSDLSNLELQEEYSDLKKEISNPYEKTERAMVLLLLETQMLSRGLINKSESIYGDLMK